MREIVLVPTWKRRDMLYCCLEAIRAAEPDIKIEVFPDRGTEETDLCQWFKATEHKTIPHTLHGNTYNVMEALKWAYKHHAELVYVIEDDAIVDPSFFFWCHQALAEHPGIFAACGWRYSPDALPPCEGPDVIIPWYLSVASAIPKRSLYGIVQHARADYYSDMQGYLDCIYPQSPRKGSMHYEQDGLVLRVCEAEGKSCAWPRRPRVTHIGWAGYHMPEGEELKGTLEERVAIIKLLLKDPAMLRSMLNGGIPPEIRICEVCQKPLLCPETPHGHRICVECFHEEYPALPRTAFSHYYRKQL